MLAKNSYQKEALKQIATRDGYGEGLVEAGKKDPNVMVLCCDLTESTRSEAFQKIFPERFVEIGVAEQNMAGVAAGLALEGKIPFCSSYAVFNPGRNWDQIRVSVCYNRANVKIVGAHAGISVGPDGATHQALEDIAITRVLPNMTVIAPCDYLEAKKATIALARLRGPAYIRFTRHKTSVFTVPKTPFRIGRAEVFRAGKDVTVIGCGPVLYEALLVADQLRAQKIDVEVINCHTVKPLDVTTIVRSARKTRHVVTVEEHQIHGGLGSAVTEALARHYPVPVEMVGMPDSFGESGEPEQLWKKYGMDAVAISKAIKKVLSRK